MSNPGFPGPEGSIRFIVSVPSCASSPRKSWRSCPEGVRFEAAFRLACGERFSHVHFDIVREHADQEVGADPRLAAVADQANLEVGRLHRPERPLDSSQPFVGQDEVGADIRSPGTLVRTT